MAGIDWKRVIAVAAAAAVGLLLWNSKAVFPLKLLAVLFHEAGHALAAKLVGGEVESLNIDSLQGGLCRFAIEPTFVNRVVTSSAGYVGSALVGASLLFVALRLRSGKAVLWAMSGLVGTITLAWGWRSPFTLAVGLGLAVVLGVLAKYLSAGASQLAALFLAVFNSLYALYDLKDDLWDSARRSGTDAALLAEATYIPSVVWAFLWTVFALALLGLALWLGTRSRRPSAGAPPLRKE